MRILGLNIERASKTEQYGSNFREYGSADALFNEFDPVEVTGDAILVQDRLAEPVTSEIVRLSAVDISEPPDLRELGVSGMSSWWNFARDDYNAELRGQSGYKKYDQMRRSDAQVKMSLRLIKTPVLAGRWYISPASDSKRDQNIAEYVWNNLTKWMSISWPQVLTESLLCFDFGHYSFEKVYEIVDGKVRWQKLAPRHPIDEYEWKWDNAGGPTSCTYYGPNGPLDSTEIPINKLAVFSYDQEAGNILGISGLRAAYKHWYFKDTLYKIDAIQKERHGIGIPVIKLPIGFNAADKAKANEMGRNLRTNEKAYITLPPGWDMMMLKLEGNLTNPMESIAEHNKMIVSNVLAPFMAEDTADPTAKVDLFLKGTRYLADVVRDVFNHYVIPYVVGWNWGPNAAENPPELRVRRIGETVDWRTFSFALRNLVGAGLVIPDDTLLTWIRDELDLPGQDKSTQFQLPTPQNPFGAAPGAGAPSTPDVGLPRQSTASGNTQGKSTGSTGRVGLDKSGG